VSAEKALIISGGTILTMSPKFGIIEDGYVICRGQRIVEIGSRPVPEKYKTGPESGFLNTDGKIIMPGLINSHTHTPMSLLAGIADDLPLMEWLNNNIFPIEARILSPDFVYTGTLLSALAMLRSGTTTVVDGYFFENDAARAIEELGMRGVMAQGILDFPNPQYKTAQEGLSIIKAFINTWQGSDLIRPALFCHSAYTCSPQTLLSAKRLSQEMGILYFIHLAETRQEVDTIHKRFNITPVRHLARLDILSPDVIAVHCVWIDKEDIAALAKRDVKVVHCPESNMKMAAGIAPVPGLLDAGICVSLGTDGCASNNNLDLFLEMDTAAKLHKVHTGDPTAMDAQTVISMVTIKAAQAIGLGNEIGSLEPGKRADIICIDFSQPHLTPLYNIPSQLVYSASGMDVDTVIINGEILLKNRKFTKCLPDKILERANMWAKRIMESK